MFVHIIKLSTRMMELTVIAVDKLMTRQDCEGNLCPLAEQLQGGAKLISPGFLILTDHSVSKCSWTANCLLEK